MRRSLLCAITAIGLLVPIVGSAADDGAVTADQAFFYPREMQTLEYDGLFDLAFGRVPYDVVEENQTFRWPLFGLRGRIGLPEGFTFYGSVETNVVNFNLTGGPRWNYEFTDRLTANIGFDVAWFGGRLNAGQFDQSANGWQAFPNVTVGYRFGDVALTGKFNFNYVLSVNSRTGDIETSRESGFYNGWTISFWAEQPLWGDNYVLVGLRANHMKFYYPTWLLAPTFDKFYYVPEFTLGLKL